MRQKIFAFILMPFDKGFEDTYILGIKSTVEQAGMVAERVDEQVFHREGILARIYNQIDAADFIIADMTGRNPNVFYEVGYAHAKDKLCILVTNDPNDIPFDLKHHRHIVYTSINDLKKRLSDDLAVIKGEIETRTQPVTARPRKTMSVRPKFRISFHPDEEGCFRTPVIMSYPMFGSSQVMTKEFMATYVRIRMEALSKTTLTGCRAFLTKLQRESPDGKTLSDIALPHGVGLRGSEPFDLHPNVICTADFLMCTSENNKAVVPESNWPLSLRNIFDETGTYHFSITVNGGGISESIAVAVGWPGRWDEITAYQVSPPMRDFPYPTL